jgi:uncharacterized membrane protein YdjX (TVP38/TMEM64 family)
MNRIREQGPFAILVGYAAAMPLLVSGSGLWFLSDIVAFFESAGRWASVHFTMITAAALVLALLPSIVMSALAGALFGIYGIVPAVISYLVACSLSFEIARRFLRPSIQAAIQRSPRAQALQVKFHEADFKIVVLGRLSPAIPFAVMNLLLGVANLPRSTYLWGSFLGMLPRTLVAVAAGAGAQAAFAALSQGSLPPLGGPLDYALPLIAVVGTAGLLWFVGNAVWKVLRETSRP